LFNSVNEKFKPAFFCYEFVDVSAKCSQCDSLRSLLDAETVFCFLPGVENGKMINIELDIHETQIKTN
jgi:hypothetical protein